MLIVCFQRFSNGEKNDAPISFPEVWRPAGREWDANPDFLLQAVVTYLGATMEEYMMCLDLKFFFSSGAINVFDVR